MTLRLIEPAHPTRQLRRAIEDPVRVARQALDMAPPDVHAARRALKRARALVRLGRAMWEPSDRRELAHRLRDAGRHASGTRDVEARIEAVDRLRSQIEPRYAEALEVLHDRLTAASCGTAPARDSHDPITAARTEVEQAEHLLERHPPRGHGRGVAIFAPGLTRIAEKGATALEHVRLRPTDTDAHHELRKRAKDMRHVVEFLEPAWPAVLGVWASELHRLTDDLGEANDLTLLLDWIEVQPHPEDTSHTTALGRVLREVRAARWATALSLATRIWASPPEDFVRAVLAWAGLREPVPQVPQ
ncbi:MAG: CHAD domain-containing protein [Gemmatimonadetes bacterium]|nr:CHAD domain-containing protein [Gemmatimonadota bacterium]